MRSKASRRSATLAQRLLPIAFVSASLFWSFVASPLSPEASAAALTSQQVGQFIDPSPTPWPGDAFGQSVSVSSDGFLAVIGAPGATGVDGTASEGLVYVYGQEDGAWTEIAELAPSDASPDTNFGQTVSISSDGSVVLVGEASAGTPGEAYIFVEPSNGWSGVVNESAILVGGDSTIHSDFGVSAAITPDGTEAVIGAQYQGGTTSGQGEAYVFTEPAGGWNGSVSPTELLLPNPSDVVPNFGGMGNSISVSSDGSTVAVGFSWAYGAGGAGCGDVYIYVAPEGGWGGSMTPTSTLIAPTGQSGGHFGLSLVDDQRRI